MDKRLLFILFVIIIIAIPISFASDDINFTDNMGIVEDNYYNSTVNEIDNNQFNSDDVNFEKNFSTNLQENDSSNNRGNTIIHNNLNKYYGSSDPFTITILDSNNVGVSGISITFNVHGVNYFRTTNSLGVASLDINLDSGTYDAYTTINDFSVTYHRYITILPTIIGNDVVKYYKNGTQYYATFYDTSGNLLTNTQVTFNINGVFYTRTTNSSGVAKLNINLDPGFYIITAINPCNNELRSNNITVLSTMSASDLIMNYGDGSKFKVYLVDGQGNPYANQVITFNINGLFYYRTTDSNGIASLDINLAPGNYIVTSSHNGLSISNNIIVN